MGSLLCSTRARTCRAILNLWCSGTPAESGSWLCFSTQAGLSGVLGQVQGAQEHPRQIGGVGVQPQGLSQFSLLSLQPRGGTLGRAELGLGSWNPLCFSDCAMLCPHVLRESWGALRASLGLPFPCPRGCSAVMLQALGHAGLCMGMRELGCSSWK